MNANDPQREALLELTAILSDALKRIAGTEWGYAGKLDWADALRDRLDALASRLDESQS